MWIDRKIESVIQNYVQQFPAILLTGPRQVGKTSILTHLFPDATYVCLDDPGQAANAENVPEDFLNNLKPPVIIDEAQYAPGLFRYLKIFIDQVKKKGQYLITGSQYFPLMQNVSESLAGRCGIINLHTLSTGEITNTIPSSTLEEIIIKGGFPALYSEAIDYLYWYSSYTTTYLERDVRNIIHVTNLRDFNRFLRVLALRTGQILSLSDVARDVGVSPNTIKAWLSVLKTSQHIYLLEPYFKNMGKRLVKSPKIYFCDTGLLLHLLGIQTWDELQRSPLAGYVWETYIFNQIYRHYINQGQSEPNLWFWRTGTGEEVDFLIEKGSQFTGIECKLTSTPGKSDLKGFLALKQYYGDNCLLKSILACKVTHDYTFKPGVFVSNFTACRQI